MGRCPNNKNSKKKHYSHKSARRAKFLVKGDDMIHSELQQGGEPKPKVLDEDLPGLGQHYCVHCDRHFGSADIRDEHYKTKKHKKRVKMMHGPAPHTQLDAELAGGLGRPDNGPKLRGESNGAVAMAL